MYRLGYRVYSGWYHKRALYVSAAVAAAIIVAIIWYFKAENKPLIINPTQAVTSKVAAPSSATKKFKEAEFTFSLPKSWVRVEHQTTPDNMYYYRDTTKYQDARYLYVYVDTIPSTYAVNKLLPVTVSDNHLSIGALSDTCSNFTGPASPNSNRPAAEPSQESKWEGVSFICDLSNYERNVVGTSSVAGINKFVLSGPKTGKHSFFFVYTDHTAEPEYDTLSEALNTLQAN